MQHVFKVGDKAVYPAHGVGEVTAIEKRAIGGHEQTFYILRILENGMKIMVPTDNVRQVGLREVIGKGKVERVFNILREKTLSVETTTWNRRYREYMEKIKTGSVFEVAEVLRDLYLLKVDKDLSFCELKLLDQARGLLVRELAVARGCTEEDIGEEFRKIFDREAMKLARDAAAEDAAAKNAAAKNAAAEDVAVGDVAAQEEVNDDDISTEEDV